MMISYWTGFILFVLIGILFIVVGVIVTRKSKSKGALGGLLGFFLGFGFVMFMLFYPGRCYIVSGNEEFTDYIIFGDNNHTLKDGTQIEIKVKPQNCMVINDWDQPVIVEYMKYGGYGFGGDTDWIDPGEVRYFEENKIWYFFESNSPPDEISIKGGEYGDEYIRLWLRNKRD